MSDSKDFFYNLSVSRQHIISLVILFIIPLVLFFDATLGGKQIQRHDITQWRAGAESIIEYREQFGQEPLWASNMYGGMPSYVISVDNKTVPHLDQLANIFRKIYPAFPYWVMMFGMYFLLTLMGFRPLSAVFGSMMFGLTSYFAIIIIAGHTSKFFALAIIPWMFAGYWKLSRSENKAAGLLLLMVALALEIRAGHPQITYYFFYLLGFLWIFDTWNAHKKGELKGWGLVTSLLIVGGIIGLLGNTERILTLQEYAQYSIRGGSDIQGTTGLDTNYAFAWSQGIAETLTLLIPDAFGGASPNYWGPKSVTSGPHYLGILTLPLILIALFKTRKKLVYLFFGVGMLGAFFAWGENFLLLNKLAFNYIPFFDKFRAPETWLVLTAFCFTIVSVHGLEWIFDSLKEKNTSIKAFYAPFGGALAIAVVLFLSVNSMDFIKEGEINNIANQIAQQNQVSPQNPQVQQRAISIVNSQFVPEREDKAKKDVLRLFIFIVLSGALIYMIVGSKLSIGIGSLAFILLLGVDMIPVDWRYMPERSFVASNVDAERYILSQRRDIDTFIQENISDNGIYPYRVFPLLDNPFGTAIPSYYYPSLGGYTAVKLSTVQDVLMSNQGPLFAGPTGINLDLLSMLNTKYLTYSPGLSFPGLSQAFQGQGGVVYEVDNVLPKAFFVDSLITVQDPKEAYQYLFPGQLDFSNTAVVEYFEGTTSFDSTSTVEVAHYTGPEMTIKTSRSTPGFLVLSEIYYPEGWDVLLDGEEIEIHKTNYLVRGFQIPAGEHTLELDFNPTSYSMGKTISWISFACQVLLTLFVGFTYFKKRNASAS